MTDQTPSAPEPVQPVQPAAPAGQPAGQTPAQPVQPAGGAPAGQPAAPMPPLTPAEDKQWGMFSHFGGVLGPLPALIIFLVFKDRGAFTKQESKEALNWQITWVAAAIILGILNVIVSAVLWGTASFGSWGMISIITGLLTFISWIPYLANIVFSIIGGVKVNNGNAYRYPIAIRLIK